MDKSTPLVAAFILLVVALLFWGGGAASGWEDLRSPVSAIRLAGANPATSQTYRSSQVLAFAQNINQYVYVVLQIPHGWVHGSNVSVHIHWTIPVNATVGSESVKWDLTYSWADTGEVFPAASNDTVTAQILGEAQDTHFKTSWAPLNGAGHTSSSILLLSIKRDTAVFYNYANPVYLLEVDIHCHMDKLGSAIFPADYP